MPTLHIIPYANSNFYTHVFDELDKKHCEYKVVVPCMKGDKRFDNLDKRFEIVKSYSNLDRLLYFPKIRKNIFNIKKSVDLTGVDLIHSHTLFSSGPIAYSIFKEKHIPYIVSVRGTDINFFWKKFFFLRRQGKTILLNARSVIFISESGKNSLLAQIRNKKIRNIIEKKSSVIPNGIDDYYLSNLNIKKNLSSPQELIFMYAGVNDKNKNVYSVCKYIDSYKTDKNKVFYVIGKEVDNKLERKISRFPFVKRIQNLNKEELLQYYRKADIFVMLSKSETFGISYIESMSQGTPILFSKNNGVDGLFPDNTVGFPIYNQAEFNSAVNDIVDRYDFYSTNCNKFSKEFSWDKIVNRLVKEYE